MCPFENSLWAEFHVGFIRGSPDLFIVASLPVELGKLRDIYIRPHPASGKSTLHIAARDCGAPFGQGIMQSRFQNDGVSKK